MATGRDIRAGRAYVELNTKDKLTAGLKAAGAKFLGFAKLIGAASLAIGGAALTGAGIAIRAFSNMGSEMNDLAARTGMTVEGLSELKFAAEQSSASLDDVVTGAKKMQQFIAKAGDEAADAAAKVGKISKTGKGGFKLAGGAVGSKEATDQLAKLGLTLEKLKGMSPDEQFRTIAKAVAAIKDPAERAAAAVKVFGKTGTVLLPMAMEIDALTKRARELGIVMSTGDAAAADRFGDTLGELWAVVKRGVFLIGGAIEPAVRALVDGLVRGSTALIGLIQQNRASITAWAQTIVAAAAWVGNKFVELGKGANDALGGALGALTSGEFKIAGELAVNSLKQAFLGLKSFMQELWETLANGIVATMINAAAEIKKIWAELPAFIERMKNFVGDTEVTSALKKKLAIAEAMQTQARESKDPILMKATDNMVKELQQQLKDAFVQMAEGQKTDPAVQAQLDAIDKERAAKLAALTQIAGKVDDAEKKQLAEEVIALQEKADALREKLAKEQKEKKAGADIDARLGEFFAGVEGRAPIIDPDEIGDAVATAAKKVFEAKGTFNASALQSLQGGKDDAIAKATQDTAKNTHTMVTRGLKFVYQA